MSETNTIALNAPGIISAPAKIGGSGIAESFQLKEASALTRLALPMTATALVNMGMSVTDVALMSWIGPQAVAAGAIVSDFYSIIFYLGAGVIAAAAPEIAQAVGAGRSHVVRRATQQGLWMAAMMSIFMFIGVWFTGSFLGAFGIDADIVGEGKGYAAWMAMTIVPMMGVTLWRNVYAAVGMPRVFLIATLAALPINAAADYVLMFGIGDWQGMGLAGAGVASAIVAIGIFVGLGFYASKNSTMSRYHFFSRFPAPDLKRLKEMVRIGAPIGFTNLAEMGVYLLSTLVAGLFGIKALAAHAITLRLCGIFYAIPVGLSQAATVRVGHAVGAKDTDAIGVAARNAMILSIIGGSAAMAAILMAGDGLAWLFLDTADANAAAIAAIATPLLMALGVIQIGTGLGVVGSGILRGLKDTKMPMIFSCISYWGVGTIVFAIMVFGADFQTTGIWVGLAAGSLASTVLNGLRVRKKLKA
ncbi:MAG: MATE family efflux transporter [Rhodospirillaceae bacterium]|jgi:multidrug resistance protein, MATE family|nr:MATE family efflux transporter [Rhodospirillaceae bacterium]